MPEGKVAKNTAYLMSAFIGQKVLSFVYFTIVARSVGVESSGRYFLAVSFATIFAVFMDLGLANVLIRETAKRPADGPKLLANAMGIKGLFTLAAVGLTNLVAWLLGYPVETRLMIFLASLVMVIDTMYLVWYGAMRGLQNLKYEAIGVAVGQALTLAFGGLFIYLRLPLPWLVIAIGLSAVWNWIWAYWNLKRRFGFAPLQFSLDPKMLRFLWRVTIPFALAGIFARVYSYIDSVMLSQLADETAVGHYGVAYKITFSFQCLAMSFAAALYPAMSAAAVQERQRLPGMLTMSIRYLLLLVAPIVVGICVLAGPLIRVIYGPEFSGSILPLQILLFSLIFAYLYWPTGMMLNADDRQAANTVVMGATMVLNVVLNAFLLPKLGAVGAAWASVASNLLLFGGALWVVGRWVIRLETPKLLDSAWRISLAAAVMGLIVWQSQHYVPLLAAIAIGMVVYPVAILLVRAVSPKEARSLLNIFLRRGRGISDLTGDLSA